MHKHACTHRVNAYYLQVSYLWLCPFSRIMCYPQINPCGPFVVTCGHTQSNGEFELPEAPLLSWGWTTQSWAFLYLSLRLEKNVLFGIYLVSCFSHFCAFCWSFILLLKCPPSNAQMLFHVPKHRKAVMCPMEKERTCVRYVSFRRDSSCCGHECDDRESTVY